MRLKLAVFDLDGTLKKVRDPYVYLHQRLGTWPQSQAFFSDGLAGRIPYEEWLRLDAAMWKGVPRAHIEALFQADLGVEYVAANEILFEAGRVSGEVRAHIPEGGKGAVMEDLLAHMGVRPAECLAVGDGESDVALFQRAGVSVAVAPHSDLVRTAADIVLWNPGGSCLFLPFQLK